MEFDFLLFSLIIMIVLEIVEYELSKFHLYITILIEVFALVQIDSIVSFDTIYAIPIMIGLLLFTSNRLLIITRSHRSNFDPDEVLIHE